MNIEILGKSFTMSMGLDAVKEITAKMGCTMEHMGDVMNAGTPEEQIENIIELCELGSFIDLPIRTYSTGMQMRLAFAVSTMIRPDILIMDEWLSVGDESFKDKAENRMTDLVNNAQLLIIASHSKDLLYKICNRIIWLEHGKIKMDGKPYDVLPEYFN